jgi:hypothetical protein
MAATIRCVAVFREPYSRQTISARLGKGRAEGSLTATVLANSFDWVMLKLTGSPNHCGVANDAYLARMAAAPAD